MGVDPLYLRVATRRTEPVQWYSLVQPELASRVPSDWVGDGASQERALVCRLVRGVAFSVQFCSILYTLWDRGPPDFSPGLGLEIEKRQAQWVCPSVLE